MNTYTNTYTITDLRQKTLWLLKQTSIKGYIYLLRRSRPKAALVDIKYLTALQEAYEDNLDIQEFDQTINLKRISLAKHKKLLK